MKSFFIAFLLLLVAGNTGAKQLKVLFIGNSYTDVNNLPEIVKQLAASMGDTLVYGKSAPGGYTFADHVNDAGTLNLVLEGDWDAVVLQEQSQLPSFPISQVETLVFPYARQLDSLIHISNPCATTVFYMTWGRKNGDAQNCPQWPPVCTYEGMDSLLESRYTMMAENNQGWISPVAAVWRHIRNLSTSIELYQADESHPTPAGSYAAALSFYAVLFGKDASASGYNFSLNANDAATIRNVARMVVYDSLARWRQYNNTALAASFTYNGNAGVFTFESTSTGDSISNYMWDFGDGSPGQSIPSVTHTFAVPGLHQVCLTVTNNCGEDTYCASVNTGTVGISGIEREPVQLYPNPAKGLVYIRGGVAARVHVYDATGRLVLHSENVGSINMSGYQKGVYQVVLYNKEGSIRYNRSILLE